MPSAFRLATNFLVLIAALLLAGCSPASINNQASHPAQFLFHPSGQTSQSVQLASSAWKTLFPIPNTILLNYAVASDDPQIMYACTSSVLEKEGVMTFWRTRDAGQHWSTLPLSPTGATCSISLASSQSQRVGVTIEHISTSQCPSTTVYLSTDGGGSWSSSAPTQKEGACSSGLVVTNHHFYLECDGVLLRSDDGITWSHLKGAFPAGVSLLAGKDESVAITVVRASPNSSYFEEELWISQDAGHSWQRKATIVPPADNFWPSSSWASDAWPASGSMLYAVGADQLPSDLYEVKAFQKRDGQQWARIPALPVPGANQEHQGLFQILTQTLDGSLLAFGPDPSIGVPASTLQNPITSFWLWIWNPSVAHWQVLSTPLNRPVFHDCAAYCWHGTVTVGPDHSSYLVVHRWGDGNALFRIKLPI